VVIARKVAQGVVVQQFSPVVVAAVALAVIALAEYLWTFDIQREVLPGRRDAIMRIAPLLIGGIIFMGAIDGGLALFRAAYDQYVSLHWQADTPFTEYRIPALALMSLVGGSALLAATTAFVHREWVLLASMACGLAMLGQATYLWTRAYPLRRMRHGHAPGTFHARCSAD
jgi:hypothetical protein